MKASKIIFDNALNDGDVMKLKQGLSGMIIRNGNHKSNTLNYTIKKMLNKGTEFYPVLITELFKHGAKICNYAKNNTLCLTIECAKQKIVQEKHKSIEFIMQTVSLLLLLIKNGAKAYKKNMFSVAIIESEQNLEIIVWIISTDMIPSLSSIIRHGGNKTFLPHLVKLLINHGIKSNEGNDNIFSCAIQSKNIELINIIGNVGCKPHNPELLSNKNFDKTVSLTHAVNTHNIEIVKLAFKYGSLPDNSNISYNTLIHALGTQTESGIICEILRHGAKCDTYEMYISILGNLCIRTNSLIYPDRQKINQDISIINIMMCAGFKVREDWYKIIQKEKIYHDIELKLLTCYKLLNLLSRTNTDTEQVRIKELKNQLVILMDKLCEEHIDKKEMKMNSLLLSLNFLPECLVDIIYHYQHDDPMLPKYIYWNDLI